ncbi:MAG: alkaline phosphatase family protein [Bacteroidota bacterium]|nr:alkaline phosphatase family protein [Bacteroidota bacterium]
MGKIQHVLMLFLDGVGVGKKDASVNPFFSTEMPSLKELLGGNMFHLRDCRYSSEKTSVTSINTTLGVSGLPQSGTGQAALLTGMNAPRIIGKHFGPYLYSSLKPIVAEQSIFRKLQARKVKCCYANAFPRQYFEYLNSTSRRTTAITHAWLTAGNQLNDAASLETESSLSADITNERWHKLGYPNLPIISPEEAGNRLIHLTKENNFVLYEYFFTDHAGHSQSKKEAIEVLERLDKLIKGIVNSIDYDSMMCIITSDHGNLEDLSTKSHTRNPVPLIAIGKYHHEVVKRVKNLTHIALTIFDLLT